jgi:hypothetical protein
LAHVSLADEHHLYFYEEGDADESLTDRKGWCLTKTFSEIVFYFFSAGPAVV